MKLTITFDVDGKHKQKSEMEIELTDDELSDDIWFISGRVTDVLSDFLRETKTFVDREAAQET